MNLQISITFSVKRKHFGISIIDIPVMLGHISDRIT